MFTDSSMYRARSVSTLTRPKTGAAVVVQESRQRDGFVFSRGVLLIVYAQQHVALRVTRNVTGEQKKTNFGVGIAVSYVAKDRSAKKQTFSHTRASRRAKTYTYTKYMYVA